MQSCSRCEGYGAGMLCTVHCRTGRRQPHPLHRLQALPAAGAQAAIYQVMEECLGMPRPGQYKRNTGFSASVKVQSPRDQSPEPATLPDAPDSA
jgi:hypothetical protein